MAARNFARDGHLRSSVVTACALAERRRRARHGLRPSGVPRSCDHVLRKLATKNAPIVLRVLPSIENASFVGKGRAGATGDSAAGTGGRRGHSAGRWAASPLRTTGCLKEPKSIMLRVGAWALAICAYTVSFAVCLSKTSSRSNSHRINSIPLDLL